MSTFLRDSQASGFPTYISKTPNEDVLTSMKLSSLPAVLIYGSEGEIERVFVDAGETAGFTYENDIIPLVSALIQT